MASGPLDFSPLFKASPLSHLIGSNRTGNIFNFLNGTLYICEERGASFSIIVWVEMV